jgi:hypothetical protein
MPESQFDNSGKSIGAVFAPSRASAPSAKQNSHVSAIDAAIRIEVCRAGSARRAGSPTTEQDSEISTANDAIGIQITAASDNGGIEGNAVCPCSRYR